MLMRVRLPLGGLPCCAATVTVGEVGGTWVVAVRELVGSLVLVRVRGCAGVGGDGEDVCIMYHV